MAPHNVNTILFPNNPKKREPPLIYIGKRSKREPPFIYKNGGPSAAVLCILPAMRPWNMRFRPGFVEGIWTDKLIPKSGIVDKDNPKIRGKGCRMWGMGGRVKDAKVLCCKWESEVLQVGGWWVGEWRMQRFCVARMNQQDESRRKNESSQRIKRSRCDSYTSVAKFEDARMNNQDESRMNRQDESRGLDVTHTQV